MNLAEAPTRRNTGSADKATITDEVPVERISSPFIDHQQDTSETMVSKPKEVDGLPRGRRIVRSTSKNSNTLPPTPPRSGSGRRKTSGLRRYCQGYLSYCQYIVWNIKVHFTEYFFSVIVDTTALIRSLKNIKHFTKPRRLSVIN